MKHVDWRRPRVFLLSPTTKDLMLAFTISDYGDETEGLFGHLNIKYTWGFLSRKNYFGMDWAEMCWDGLIMVFVSLNRIWIFCIL